MTNDGPPFFLCSSSDTDWPRHSFVDIRNIYKVELKCLSALMDQDPHKLILPQKTFHTIVNAWNNRDKCGHYKSLGCYRASSASFASSISEEKRALYCNHFSCSHPVSRNTFHYKEGYLPVVASQFKSCFEINSELLIGCIVWIRGIRDNNNRLGISVVPKDTYEGKVSSVPGNHCKELDNSYTWTRGQAGLVVERDTLDMQAVHLFVVRYPICLFLLFTDFG